MHLHDSLQDGRDDFESWTFARRCQHLFDDHGVRHPMQFRRDQVNRLHYQEHEAGL